MTRLFLRDIHQWSCARHAGLGEGVDRQVGAAYTTAFFPFLSTIHQDGSSDQSAGVHIGPRPCHPYMFAFRAYGAGGIVTACTYCLVCFLRCFRMLIGCTRFCTTTLSTGPVAL